MIIDVNRRRIFYLIGGWDNSHDILVGLQAVAVCPASPAQRVKTNVGIMENANHHLGTVANVEITQNSYVRIGTLVYLT